jgi:cyclohexa-1,5-dienecarbonyl-CoA hydratase
MGYQKIRTEPFLEGQALRVVLDDPKGNVLDSVMMDEINGLLDELAGRRELKLLCFVGEGKQFCFGASVPEHVGDKAAGMLEAFHGMFFRLVDLAIPTAAAVKGRCLGGGMELAMFCNRVVARPDALFGQPEIQLAVLPPVASLILPLKIGQSAADDINLTGRTVSAVEGMEMGLVDQVSEDPMSEIEAWAERELAPKSAEALRWAVRASRWQFNRVLREQLKQVERLYLEDLMSTHDANEGLAAFLEKRKPSWTND